MTNGGDERAFVDTNVLVYATIPESPFHDAASAELRRWPEGGATLWISHQVLREFIATLSRPQTYGGPIAPELIVRQIEHFQGAYSVVADSPAVLRELLSLLLRFPIGGKHVHDANIVATMRNHHIEHLITHNLDDFARFGSLITVVPIIHVT